MAKEYVFLDEWDVDAPQEAVFGALADARTYPEWWTPVYIDVEGDEDARSRRDDKAALQGEAAVHAEDHLEDRRLRPSHPLPGRGGGGSHRDRQVDAHAQR